MTEENQGSAEPISAPEQEVTATPDTVQANLPEVSDEQEEQKPAEKVFTQAELDEQIGKRLVKAQRKWEREQAARAAEMQIKSRVPTDLPKVDQFESPEAYAEALAEKKAEELLAKREAVKRQTELMESYHAKEEEFRDKYPDFDQVAYNQSLRITDVMADTIRASEMGPELAYHLGSNPKEADRISRLPALLQAKEIGKIEAKLADSPPVKKVSSAPSPIVPVTARASGTPVTDTTDPRSTKTLSTSEWIEAERQRQIKKWQASQNR